MEHALNTDPGAVHLVVGNQSFEVDPVDIEVRVDGEVVAGGRFSVRGDQPPQHNWTRYELHLAPGPHLVVASSGRNAAPVEATIEVPGVGTVTVAYWDSDGGMLTLEASDAWPATM